MIDTSAHSPSERPALDVALIVSTARAIAATDGLQALTMRRLGRELGVEAMSIYHHVPSKAALLELLVDTVFDDVFDDVFADGSISDAAAHLARSVRGMIRDHPELTSLLVADRRLFDSEAGRTLAERLRQVGIDESTSAQIVASLVGFAVGQPTVTAGANAGEEDAEFETGLRLLLIGLRAEIGDNA